MANTKRDSGREAFWRRIMDEFRTSGLTGRAFCRGKKLQESAFYFWRRTIQERNAAPHRFQECRSNPCGKKSPAFVPLVLNEVREAADLSISANHFRSSGLPD